MPRFPAVGTALRFLKAQWIAALGCSAVALIPCYWHRHIQATDLGSHVYNAWLAQLIRAGQAPGLRIVPQTSNVLFDLILSGLFRAFGPLVAEKIAVSLAVLVFFWGGFALCSVAGERPAWSVVPLLTMVSYGLMFNLGFMNLYLSVGFSLFAIAVLVRGKRWDYALLLPVLALIWMSHLLGTAGVIAVGGMLLVMRSLRARTQLMVSGAALAIYFIARWYLVTHYFVLKHETNVYWYMGADQLVIFGVEYQLVAIAVVTIAAIGLALRLRHAEARDLPRVALWLQVYALVAIAVVCAPGGIYHPKLQLMGYLPDRLSLYSAVFLCALMAAVRPGKVQVALLASTALMFFSFLYRDTGKLERLEAKVEQVVAPLSPPARIVPTFFPEPKWRIHEQHVTDRACIGHCFAINNYEAGSSQFRIKAAAGNRIVETYGIRVGRLKDGIFMVQEQDLPLSTIYVCGTELQEVCIHPLSAGEYSGQVAYDAKLAAAGKKTGQ